MSSLGFGRVSKNQEQLTIDWLNQPTILEERRFWEQHCNEFFPLAAGAIITQLIVEHEQAPELQGVLRTHLQLLEDTRRREKTLGAVSVQTIRDVYVDMHGDQGLDVPIWLQDVYRRSIQLDQIVPLGGGLPTELDDSSEAKQAREERMVLYWQAFNRAKTDKNVAPEVTAGLCRWFALSINHALDRLGIFEQSVQCLVSVLYVYTMSRYPNQYALTLSFLGELYEKRPEHVEQAIASYNQALKVVNPASNPSLYINIQRTLGRAYKNRITGDRRTNLERALNYCEEARRYAQDQGDYIRIGIERIQVEQALKQLH